MSLFQLRIFILYQAPHSQALVPACGAFFFFFSDLIDILKVVKSLPNDKILNWSKLKTFADDKTDMTQMMIFVHGRIENIVGN